METNIEQNMESKLEPTENKQKLKIKDLLFVGLVLLLGAAHVIVMLQSVGIIRADR